MDIMGLFVFFLEKTVKKGNKSYILYKELLTVEFYGY